MAEAGARREFRMELDGEEEGMARELHHFGEVLRRSLGGNDHALFLELGHIGVVHLIAVTMAFSHDVAVDLVGERTLFDGNFLTAEAHRAAEVGRLVALLDAARAVLPLGDEGDDGMGRVGIELGGVGSAETAHVTGELDDGHLHAEADAEERDLVFTGELDGLDHAFRATLAETSRDEDRIDVLKDLLGAFLFDLAGVDVADLDAGLRADAGVDERFVERLVAVGVVDVLADHGDRDLALRVLDATDDVLPGGEIGGLRLKAELLADEVVKMLGVEHERHFVDRGGVGDADHAVHRHVGEERDLGALAFRDHVLGATEEHVGIDALFAELLNGVLGRLRLQLAGGRDPRAERQVDEAGVVAAHAEGHLADGLDERQGLNVADRTADFNDGHVGLAVKGAGGAALDELLNFVRDVRDHLNGLAEVFAATFLAKHALVDLTRREVVGLVHLRGDEAFVVTEVEVGFHAVNGDVAFSVLVGVECSRVDVNVRVKFLDSDVVTSCLQEFTD